VYDPRGLVFPPSDPFAALFPTAGPNGLPPTEAQSQFAANILQTGSAPKYQGMDNYGNYLQSTIGGAPAFNPFARAPNALPFLSGLPPEIQGLFDFAPTTLENAPAYMQNTYPGQQVDNLVSRAESKRTELQALSNRQLGIPKNASGNERNQAIVDQLNAWGNTIGYEGNINDRLYRAPDPPPQQPPGSGGGVQFDAGPLVVSIGGDILGGGGDDFSDLINSSGGGGGGIFGRTLPDGGGVTRDDSAIVGSPSDGPPAGSGGDGGGSGLGSAIAGLIVGGAQLAASAAQANNVKKGKAGIPGAFQPAVGVATNNIINQLQRPGTTYLGPKVAPMSSFEIAALGGIANQALNPQNQQQAITQAPTFRPLT